MTPELLLRKFGYLGVFIGTFFEGETILVIAGFFAQQHYLRLWLVIITAFLGAFLGHGVWFWIGRAQGAKLVDRFPGVRRHFEKALNLFERHGAAAIFITQYLYGLRMASAIVFGISRIPTATFFIYQAISCIIWATIIATLGFFFGRAVERVLGTTAEVEKYALIALVTIGILVALIHRLRERRKRRHEPKIRL